MSFIEWLTLVLVCWLGAASPGPSLIVVVNQTVNGSRLHGLVSAIAHGAVVGGWAWVTVLGLSQILLRIPVLQPLLTGFAVIYLLYLAWGAWRSGQSALPGTESAAVSGSTLRSAALDGASIALLNPKLALFFMALFAPLVSLEPSMTDLALLVLTPWLIDTLWYMFIAVLISGSVGLRWIERYQTRINQSLALALILLALIMLIGLFAEF